MGKAWTVLKMINYTCIYIYICFSGWKEGVLSLFQRIDPNLYRVTTYCDTTSFLRTRVPETRVLGSCQKAAAASHCQWIWMSSTQGSSCQRCQMDFALLRLLTARPAAPAGGPVATVSPSPTEPHSRQHSQRLWSEGTLLNAVLRHELNTSACFLSRGLDLVSILGEIESDLLGLLSSVHPFKFVHSLLLLELPSFFPLQT